MEPLIVFLDTETTGLTEKDRLVQISYKVWNTDESATEIFNPPEGVELTYEATSVHHITREMVKGKPAFMGSQMWKRLDELFKQGAIMVAHNALFDLGIISSEGLKPQKFVCTLKVARYLDEKAELTNHKLQYLRYAYNLDVNGRAHDAEGDVAVLEKLFEHLLKDVSLEKMIEISSQPSLIRRFSFTKHKGELVSDVLKNDRSFLEWFLSVKSKENPIDEDWVYTLTEALKQ
ncbi:MAG: 3'-5' exonuclease [Minisyncoccia bacterium]